VGAHLGMWRFILSHSPTFSKVWDVILGLPSWLAPLQAFVLVMSPKLRLWHKMCKVWIFEITLPFIIWSQWLHGKFLLFMVQHHRCKLQIFKVQGTKFIVIESILYNNNVMQLHYCNFNLLSDLQSLDS